MKLLTQLITYTKRVSLSLVMGITTFIISTAILANPVVDNIAAGQVTIQQAPNNTTVNQSSQQAIINWQSFNIGAQETTHFQQPAGGIALNRINPSNGVSAIYGRLTATGQIILVNPAGLFFGPGSFVNVGGMIATTGNITDQDFLNGYYRFANVPGFNGAIVNQGRMIAADNGLIALVGGAVSNDGYIQANMGNVVLASGNAMTMTFAGNELIGFTVDSGITQRAVDKDGNELADGVKNTGSIIANGGTVMVSAKSVAGVLDHTINMEGIVQAISVRDGENANDGEIIFMSDSDRSIVRLAGLIDASGKAVDQFGGDITVTGYNILLDNTASIDASGDAGGGTILIGGNYQGVGPLPTANAVVMLSDAKIVTDALTNGNGGNAILWSDYYTSASGTITARGGSAGGNGGLIETSSKNILNVGNLVVDATAPQGQTGQWLLDPYNVTISTSADSGGSFNGGNPNVFTPSATANILNTTLNSNLENANVTITTTGVGGDDGDISVNAPITWLSSNTLLLQANDQIFINAAISGVNGALNLTAGNTAQSITSGTDASPSATGVTAAVEVNDFNILAGHWYQNDAALPSFVVNNNFVTNSGNNINTTTDPVSFTRVVGGVGSVGDPYQITDIYGLQGMGSSVANLANSYLLVNDIDASPTQNWRSGEGFKPVGDTSTFSGGTFLSDFNGNFDGQNYVIDGLYMNSNDNAVAMFGLAWANPGQFVRNLGLTNVDITAIGTSLDVAALFGSFSGSFIENIYVTGSITDNSSGNGGSAAGVAAQLSGTLRYSYNAATITSNNTDNAGGVVGYNHGTIEDSYNVGTVDKSGAPGGNIGGLAGRNDSFASITNSYSAGEVIGGIANAGGLIGDNRRTSGGSGFNDLFWDTDSSTQSGAVGSGLSSGTTGGCFTGTCTNGGTANLSNVATYAAWDITNVIETDNTQPTETWFLFSGATRPLLMAEYSTTIRTPHQVQLAGTTLDANYTLAGDVDFTSSFTNQGDVWGTDRNSTIGNGFVPIGSSGSPFTGDFDGVAGYAIDNLYINSGNNNLGLFGYTSSTSNITNLGVTNASVTQQAGANTVGGLVGFAQGLMNRVYVTGTITNLTDTGLADGFLGGIAGQMQGASAILSQSYSTATVRAPATINTVTSNYVGGLVGRLNTGSSIDQSYFSGLVHAAYLLSNRGALGVGGLSGWTSGTITNSYNTGTVIGYNYVGGLAGFLSSGTISNSYNAGQVITFTSIVGGITSEIDAGSSLTNSFWDTATSGQAAAFSSNTGTVTNVTAGTFDGSSGVNLSETLTLYTSAPYNWSAVTWNIIPDQSYPYLTAFYSTAPRAISGLAPSYITFSSGPYATINLAVDGAVQSIARSGANNFFYFLEGDNQVGLDHSIADGTPLLLYVPGAFNIAGATNTIALAPNAGGSLSGAGFDIGNMVVNTVTAGTNNVATLSNTLLDTAKGSLSDTGIIYSVTGTDLSTTAGNDFVSTTATTYDVDGNITITAADITLNGDVTISAASPIISTATSGNILFASTVDGNGNSFSVSNPNATTVTFDDVISGVGTTLTKLGAGELILNNSTSTFTGGLNLFGGTLTASLLPSAAGNSIIGTGNLAIDNAALLSYVGPTATFNRAITVGAGGGTIQIDNASNNILTLTGGIATSGALSFDITGAGLTQINVNTNGISGTGSIIKLDNGYLTFNAANTYTGTTTIDTGFLLISGTTGSLGGGDVINNGTLLIDRSTAYNVTNLISGTGELNVDGGIVTLASGNTYTGNTEINFGSITISDDSALGAAPGVATPDKLLLNGGQLITTTDMTLNANRGLEIGALGGAIQVNPATTLTYNGIFGGSDLFNKNGTGTLIFGGANTYGGPTFVNAGILVANNNNAFDASSVTVSSGATLQVNDGISIGNSIVLNGSGVGGNGALVGVGNSTVSGGISLASASTIGSTSGNFTISGNITGTDAITKSGAGTLVISGVNNSGYTGNYTIAAGTLQIGAGGTTGSLGTSNVTNNANLAFNRSDAITVSNIISGTGTLEQLGTGTTTLAGNNTYTGATTITNGILQLTNFNALGSGATQSSLISIASGAKLNFNVSAIGTLANTNTIQVNGAGTDGFGAIGNSSSNLPTLDNPIVLMGDTTIGGFSREIRLNGNISENTVGLSFTKGGSNSYVILGGNNTFTGATVVAGGALNIASANALGTGATQSSSITVNNGASLYFSNAMTFGNTSTLNITGSGVAPIIGSLTYADTGSGVITLNNPITLTGNIDIGSANGGGSSNFVLNGDISGAFSITKNGLTRLTLNGVSTYSGGTTINGSSFGRIIATNPAALGTGPININSGGILGIDLNNATLVNNNTLTVTGSGVLIENGAGTVTMNNPIVVSAGGSLSINAGTAGSELVLAGNVTNNTGSININNYTSLGAINGDVTISGIIGSGSGSLSKFGAGTTLTLANNNTYTGTTTISAGTLQLGNGGTTGSLATSSMVNNGTVIFNRTTDYEPGFVMSGSGILIKNNSNTLTLSNSNTYSGGATINAGTLLVTDTNGLGTTGTILVNDGATLEVNLGGGTLANTSTLTLNGAGDGGVGALYASAAGVDTISNPISLGSNSTVQLNGVGASRNNLNSAINLGNFNLSLSGYGGNINGDISGVGGSIANDTAGGSSWFGGANTYTGGISINAGTIFIGNAGNLSTGTVTFNGGALSLYFPTNMTLTNSIVLATNGNITVNFSGNRTINLTGGVTGTGNLAIRNNNSGNLALNLNTGDINHTGALSFIDAAGATGTFTVNSDIGSNVTSVTQSGGAQGLVLAGTNTYSGSTIITSGSLSLGSANSIPTTSAVSLSNTANASFNLNGFDATIASLSGGGATGGNVSLGANTLTTGNASNTTYSGVISGTGSVIKVGTGTFTLAGANLYTGATNINAGTLMNGIANAIPGTSALSIGATGTYDLGGFSQTLGSISSVAGGTVTSSIGTPILTSSTASNTTFSGNLTGTLSLTKNGTGTLILTGTNTYDATLVNGGTLQIGNGGTTGSLGTGTVTNNGALSINRSDGVTLTGAISGTGSFLQAGTGTTILTGGNSYSGGTTISAGTLQLGNNGATGSILGNITNNSALIFSRSDDLTFSSIISGTGTLTKNSAGMLTLGSANTYTGQTIINNGTLSVSVLNNGGSASSVGATSAATPILLGSGTAATLLYTGNTVTSNRQITVNGTGGGTIETSFANEGGFAPQLTLSGVINGNGNPLTINVGDGSNGAGFGIVNVTGTISGVGTVLTKTGVARLFLPNANTYTGGTILSNGSAFVSNNSSLGTGTIQSNGGSLTSSASVNLANDVVIPTTFNVYAANNTFTLSGDISGAGDFYAGNGNNGGAPSGTIVLSGNNSYANTYITTGTLSISNDTNFGASTGDITLSNGTTIATTGTMTINNTRQINLTGAAANINNLSGTLTINSPVNGTPLILTSTGNTVMSGDLNLSSFTMNGTGNVTLAGNNTFASNTTFNAGTLSLGSNTALGNTSLLFNNGSLQSTVNGLDISNDIVLGTAGTFTGSNNFILSGDISGGFGINKSGTSTVILTGNNTNTTTSISGGTLQIGNAGTVGTLGSGTITNNGALVFDRTDIYSVSNAINGTGTVTQQGTGGTLIIAGNNSYSGGTSLVAGTLGVSHDNALGSGTLTMSNNTLLQAESNNIDTGNAIVLGANNTISNNSYDYTLSGTVNGASDLDLNGTGTTSLDNTVGGTTRLTSVTANTDLIITASGIATTGDQTYDNAVTLGNAVVFDTSGTGNQAITFNNNVSGGQNITLQGTGTGTYNFTLNALTANDVNVTAALGSSNNTLNLNTGGTQDFAIMGTNTGDVSNIATVNTFNFNNINNLNGGSGDDSFTFNGGTLSGSINGGAGVNSLIGADLANLWAITSNNGGTVTGLGGGFSNIENLTGGTNVDTFNFTEGFSISGLVDGGDNILNHINFTTFTSVLTLSLDLPITTVFDRGTVRYANDALVASFNAIQQSTGNNLGFIILPDKPNITVTYYDDTLLNGEIGDPFFFNGWNIGNPPPPIPITPSIINPDVAGIVNQPQTNADDNDNYGPNYTNYSPYDPTVVNQTFVDPLLDTTTVKTGAACYQINN